LTSKNWIHNKFSGMSAAVCSPSEHVAVT